ncbi:MAG: DUF6265 family protein [Myxococcota bacterium]|nr:DUF6265 family protein [Myxococcota bacterium]
MSSNRVHRTAWILAIAIAAWGCGGGRAECPETTASAPAPTHAMGPLAGYAFLAGTWVAEGDDGARIEETWTVPRGTVMPGASHTEGADGNTRSWESLRIERHGDVVRYVAFPMGAEMETAFSAVELQPNLAVFENAQHDYPQRITYALERPGVLRATVSDMQGANQRSWVLRQELR